MRILKKRKRVLVLGGGAARGLASVGVLKVLESKYGRDNMPFDMIIGSSMGSLIGAAYCKGLTAKELESEALTFNWPTLVDLGLYSTGLLKGDKLERIIYDMVRDAAFKDMKIPFALTTTDLRTGDGLVHTSGDLIKLIRASCSWPGFFSAVDIGGRLLADGGIRNSVPTKYAYDMGASFVIAVDPGFAISNEPIDNAFLALVQSVQIMGEELNAYQSAKADVVIKPTIRNVNQFDFNKVEYIIRQGEAETVRCLDRLKRKLRLHSIGTF